VLGVLASVTFFGAVEQDDSPPALDARRFANVRALQEIIPDITDRITLIVVGPEGPATMLWDPSLAEPKMVEPWSKDEGEFEYEAAFDSGGRFVVLASTPTGSQGASLRVGIPTDLGDIDLDDVDSFQWHATEIGRLAYVVSDGAGDAILYTAEVHPMSRALLDVVRVGTVAAETKLVRWDTEGFILTGGEPTTVHALDGQGSTQWSEPGHAVAAGGHTVLISPFRNEYQIDTTVVSFTRNGDRIGVVLNETAAGDVDIQTMALSRNSDVTARIDVRGGMVTLLVQGPQIPSPRIVKHDEDGLPVGFTSNDEFFVFKGNGNNDLIFFRWNIGEVYVLNIPEGFDVIGVDVG
jgi:hypothetical protein